MLQSRCTQNRCVEEKHWAVLAENNRPLPGKVGKNENIQVVQVVKNEFSLNTLGDL